MFECSRQNCQRWHFLGIFRHCGKVWIALIFRFLPALNTILEYVWNIILSFRENRVCFALASAIHTKRSTEFDKKRFGTWGHVLLIRHLLFLFWSDPFGGIRPSTFEFKNEDGHDFCFSKNWLDESSLFCYFLSFKLILLKIRGCVSTQR